MYPAHVASVPQLHEKKSAKNFDCNRGIYMYVVSFLLREKDIIPSNAMEMKTNVTKECKMTPC